MEKEEVIILEGYVNSVPRYEIIIDGALILGRVFTLAMDSTRKATDGNCETVTSYIDVECRGSLMTFTYFDECAIGRKLRVIGRLEQSVWVDSKGILAPHLVVIAKELSWKGENE